MKDTTVYREHPSYGSIRVNRVSGNGILLYDSEFVHSSCIMVEISGATVCDKLGRSWHHETDSKLRLWMTETQWAAFLSSFGNCGIPCTIKFEQEKGVIPEPPIKNDLIKRRKEVLEHLEGIGKQVHQLTLDCEKILENKSISKGKIRTLLQSLFALAQDVRSNTIFWKENFDKAMYKTAEKAKREIEAKVQWAKLQLGEEAIKQLKLQEIKILEIEEVKK